MSNILILNETENGGCEPDQDHWHPTGDHKVTIVNNSGFEQILTNITNGVLTPARHLEVIVPKDGCWQGRSGRSQVTGTYTYEDGSTAVPRTGTIDPS